MKDITKDYTEGRGRNLISKDSQGRGLSFSCENCYSTSFRKEDGRIICRKCGTVYMV